VDTALFTINHFNHIILFIYMYIFLLHLQYQNMRNIVFSHEKGAEKGHEVFGSNDTQIYQISVYCL